MRDILDKLRGQMPHYLNGLHRERNEAADEIERLRAALALSERREPTEGDRTITPDQLVELIERSPDNDLANGVSVMRSGKCLKILTHLDIEKLTDLVNRHFATSPKA